MNHSSDVEPIDNESQRAAATRRRFLRRFAAGAGAVAATGALLPAAANGSTAMMGSEPFIGEITMFAGNFAPRGWMFCEGQTLPIQQNQSLFAILGTTYGGDGRTNLKLPDLKRQAGRLGVKYIIAIAGIFPSRN